MSAIKKAVNLANLKSTAQTKLNQFISISATTLRKEIGGTVYEQFKNLPDDALVWGDVGFIPNDDLTEDALLRRELETAQAYFILYFAVPGLKEFELGSVALDKLSFGEGDLVPTATLSLERYQKLFWRMATDICKQYSDTGDIGIIII